jgi:hypothetical protein
MSKLLDALIAEHNRLKAAGWKPKFKGDTGTNVCQVMIDNNVESRNEWDDAFVDTFKEIKKNNH